MPRSSEIFENPCSKSKFTLFLPIVAATSPSVYNPNPNPNATIFNQIHLGPQQLLGGQTTINLLQTSTSNLFHDKGLKRHAGKTSANVNVYNFTSTGPFYDSFINLVYRLKEGDIFVSLAEPVENTGRFYRISKDIVKVPIVNGTGKYLNKKGHVKFSTHSKENNVIIKKLEFYFDE